MRSLSSPELELLLDAAIRPCPLTYDNAVAAATLRWQGLAQVEAGRIALTRKGRRIAMVERGPSEERTEVHPRPALPAMSSAASRMRRSSMTT